MSTMLYNLALSVVVGPGLTVTSYCFFHGDTFIQLPYHLLSVIYPHACCCCACSASWADTQGAHPQIAHPRANSTEIGQNRQFWP